MTQTHDYKAAIEALDKFGKMRGKEAWDELCATAFMAEHHRTIRHALETMAVHDAIPPIMIEGGEDVSEADWHTVPGSIQFVPSNTGWQPISTAPKDGRELILLLTPSKFPQVAYSNTWWTAGFSVECKPTHWMKIPALPSHE